jgi:hypothetical protein
VIGNRKLLVSILYRTWRLVLIDRDAARVQAMTPDRFDVLDVEPIDDRSIAILAHVAGRRAVYTLDLDRPSPRHLIDASILLSAAGGRVFVVTDESKGIAIDVAGKDPKPFEWRTRNQPHATDLIFVDDEHVVARSMADGTTRVVVPDRRRWVVVHQTGSVLARTPVDDDSSHAYLITSGGAEVLPVVRGGTSILAAARSGVDTWALVGHNTSNFDGDLADTYAETDVCKLPKQDAVAYPTRNTPARFGAIESRFFEAADAFAANAPLQIVDDPGQPTTVVIELAEPGGAAFAAMRERARAFHREVASLIGERAARTKVWFDDDRSAIVRWHRDRLREVASAGIGDAAVVDPADFDVELRDRKVVIDGTKVSCSGVLHPIGATLENLRLGCIRDDREQTIHIASIPPDGYRFDATFEAKPGDEVELAIFKDREPLFVFQTTFVGRLRQAFDVAADVHARTSLVLASHDVNRSDATIDVYVAAPPDWGERTDDTRRLAAQRAYTHFEQLRTIYELPATATLTLHVDVKRSIHDYTFDGATLEPTD